MIVPFCFLFLFQYRRYGGFVHHGITPPRTQGQERDELRERGGEFRAL
jgi:hypothetical protein